MSMRGIACIERGILQVFHPSQKMECYMKKRNPLVAGLLNMLLPGSCYLYVDRDPGRFAKSFIGGIAAITVMLILGNGIQNIRGYSLPAGLCTGILLLTILAPWFLNGQKTANWHNNAMDSTARYNAHRSARQGSGAGLRASIQKMRDEGLISKQEYDKKNATQKS